MNPGQIAKDLTTDSQRVRTSTLVSAADAHQIWMEHMRRGDFEAAWCVSDALRAGRQIPSPPDVPRHMQSIWRGGGVENQRVLVRCYHGLGDTIQFIRYAAPLRARAREVVVWAQPRLLPLLEGVEGVDVLLPLHDGSVGREYDVDLEVMELPYFFRTTIETVPAAVPYLQVTPATVDRTRGPAVGLVWKAGDWAPHRSLPVDDLGPLFDARVTWHVLQAGATSAEWPGSVGIIRGASDIMDAAATIASLDLLITVDSMPAHLAGALGTPVWTIVPADADWRWMAEGESSPWYPTMRLYRQRRAGEWRDVVRRVAADLSRLPRAPQSRFAACSTGSSPSDTPGSFRHRRRRFQR